MRTGEEGSTNLTPALIKAYMDLCKQTGARPMISVNVDTGTPEMAADLVRYFMYSSQPGEEVTKRYDDGMKWLKDVANGVVSLGLPVPETPASSTGKVVMSGPRRHFTRRSMRDY